MTNKMPVVGKRYRLQKRYLDNNNNETTRENKKVIVTKIEKRKKDSFIHYEEEDGITGCLWITSFLGLYYEELPEDNLQETEEAQEVASKDFMEGYNAGWNDFGFEKHYRFKEPADNEPKVNKTPNPVDLEKGEVSKVKRALEELKQAISKSLGKITCVNDVDKITFKLMDVRKEAQHLVDVMESEKNMPNSKPKIDMKEECVEPVDLEKGEVNEVEKALEELKYSLLLKEKHEFKGHVFFDGHKEHWEPLLDLLNRIENGAQNLVNALEIERPLKFPKLNAWVKKNFPEDYMSKPEPKIDIKEEHVDPISIWKDVSELPRCLDGAAVFYKRDGQTFIGEAHSFGRIAIYPDSNSEHLNNEDIDKVCLVGDFIKSLEQMQKDIAERN